MPRLLQEWVTEHAARRPEALAVVGDRGQLTYAELDALSNQLAGLLRDAGCPPGDRVALLARKSPQAVASLLGIFKADCTYVPLDPTSPPSRLNKILDSCQGDWLIASGPVKLVLDEVFKENARRSMRVGSLDSGPLEGHNFRTSFTLDDVSGYAPAPQTYRNGSGDPSHILFTSGSTEIGRAHV